ncbi:hypothetical protein [Bdellovibrio sp.]|uniref:hypothetical protein n=1 Tax=Bdellovibrio TaxID=958 RepID=UPI003221889B
MKSIFTLLLILALSPVTQAAEDIVVRDVNLTMDGQASDKRLSWGSLEPQIRQAILEQSQAYEGTASRNINNPPNRRMVVMTANEERAQQPVRVFGFTEKDVLAMDGDPNGAACSRRHIHDDYSNRWCHAYFIKLADTYLRSHGVNKHVAALIAASTFLPKEYLYDKNPSMADLAVVEYEVYRSDNPRKPTRITMTLFGDKTAFVTIERKF